jgi:hypothetical protein
LSNLCRHQYPDFCRTPPISGLGYNFDLVKDLCRHDNEVVKLLDDLNRRGPGGGKKSNQYKINVDNINNDNNARPTGTSKEYLMRKLEKHAPEMLDKVLAGDISPNAACIQAGLKKKMIQIPHDPEKAAKKIREHFKGEDWNSYPPENQQNKV